MNEVMVSICCTTYNHEKYIADAIESFLMQKTDFDYEILIHDDASTDKTPEIIREYEKKYPNIIKPIFQVENQHSKGVRISYTFNYPRAKGKYIAICEGDDYWTDENKLQLQVDFMEQHPDCSLCTHAAKKVSPEKKEVLGIVRLNKGDCYYSTDEVIRGGGGMFATNSMFFPTKLVQLLPDFYFNAPIGDYPLTVNLSLNGNVFYIDRFMSAYRVMSEGSWSTQIKKDRNKAIEHQKKIIKMLTEINDFTNYKYSAAVEKRIVEIEFKLVTLLGINIFRSEKYIDLRNKLTKKQKLKVWIKVYFPMIAKMVRKIRNCTGR